MFATLNKHPLTHPPREKITCLDLFYWCDSVPLLFVLYLGTSEASPKPQVTKPAGFTGRLAPKEHDSFVRRIHWSFGGKPIMLSNHCTPFCALCIYWPATLAMVNGKLKIQRIRYLGFTLSETQLSTCHLHFLDSQLHPRLCPLKLGFYLSSSSDPDLPKSLMTS